MKYMYQTGLLLPFPCSNVNNVMDWGPWQIIDSMKTGLFLDLKKSSQYHSDLCIKVPKVQIMLEI